MVYTKLTAYEKLKKKNPSLYETIKKEGDYKAGRVFGYKYRIMRHEKLGTLNGYIRVPPEHKLYWMSINEIRESYSLEPHGGITYTEYYLRYQPETGWRIGFDCAHSVDLMPFNELDHIAPSTGTYRDMDYVLGEIKEMGEKIYEIGNRDSI